MINVVWGNIAWGDVIFQLIIFAVILLIVVFIMLTFRKTIKQSKQTSKKSIINIIENMVLILILWFLLEFIGINTSYVVPKLIEWMTKFILPWIALYWLIKLIKSMEKK